MPSSPFAPETMPDPNDPDAALPPSREDEARDAIAGTEDEDETNRDMDRRDHAARELAEHYQAGRITASELHAALRELH